MSALGVITAWAAIVLCQLQLWRWWRDGRVARPAFRLIGTPYTSIATLVFLAGVVALMASSGRTEQRSAIVAVPLIMVPVLVGGWFLRRRRNTTEQVQTAADSEPSH